MVFVLPILELTMCLAKKQDFIKYKKSCFGLSYPIPYKLISFNNSMPLYKYILNPFPTDIFSLYLSQDWCAFRIFRVLYWQPICDEIHCDTYKTMFYQVNRKVALYFL